MTRSLRHGAVLCAIGLVLGCGEPVSLGREPPPAPGGVGARSDTSGEVILTWTSATRADSYNVYWSNAPGVSRDVGSLITGVQPPYTHRGLTNGQTYHYVVASVSDGGESAESAEASALPLAAADVSTITSGTSEVHVEWQPVAGAASYDIYWSTSPGVTEATGTRIAAVTSPFAHRELVNGSPHYYRIRARNTVGGGATSVSAELTATPVAVPADVTVTPELGQMTVRWSAAAGAERYNIYWANSPGVARATGTLIADATSPFTHAGLVDRLPYYYVVTGENATGESSSSVENCAGTIMGGVLDESFGSGGYMSHHNAAGGDWEDYGLGVAADAEGRALVTGYSAAPTFLYDMVLWRLDEAGALDTTFNGRGWVTHDGAAGGADSDDVGTAVIVDDSGRILVAGHGQSDRGDDDMVIWAYDSTGALDPGFGDGGIVVHHNAAGGDGWDVGEAIALDSVGRILVTGSSTGTDDDMAIWRFDADGTLDTTFGGTGFVSHNNAAGGNIHDVGRAIAEDSLGRIVVTGRSYSTANHYDEVVWRYLDTGAPDVTFGVGGFVTHDSAAGGNNRDEGTGVVVDATGRIIVAGESYGVPDVDMVLWGYDGFGALDPSFGTGGLVVVNSAAGGNDYDAATGLVLDSQGRLLVSGTSSSPLDYDMVVWRYDARGAPDPDFGNGGVVIHHNAAGGDFRDDAEGLTTDRCGRILVTGWSDNATDEDMATWRILP